MSKPGFYRESRGVERALKRKSGDGAQGFQVSGRRAGCTFDSNDCVKILRPGFPTSDVLCQIFCDSWFLETCQPSDVTTQIWFLQSCIQ